MNYLFYTTMVIVFVNFLAMLMFIDNIVELTVPTVEETIKFTIFALIGLFAFLCFMFICEVISLTWKKINNFLEKLDKASMLEPNLKKATYEIQEFKKINGCMYMIKRIDEMVKNPNIMNMNRGKMVAEKNNEFDKKIFTEIYKKQIENDKDKKKIFQKIEELRKDVVDLKKDKNTNSGKIENE